MIVPLVDLDATAGRCHEFLLAAHVTPFNDPPLAVGPYGDFGEPAFIQPSLDCVSMHRIAWEFDPTPPPGNEVFID